MSADMSIDAASLQDMQAASLRSSIDVRVLKKTQDCAKQEGENMVAMIKAAASPVTQGPRSDGHIDTMA